MKCKWLEYFQQQQKYSALHNEVANMILDYGNTVYISSEALEKRWLVTEYKGEYNVFLEYKINPFNFERVFAANFSTSERAVAFAAEMFLICCGRLHRKQRHKII